MTVTAAPRWPVDAPLLREVLKAARAEGWRREHNREGVEPEDAGLIVAEWWKDGNCIQLEHWKGDFALDINGVVRMDAVSVKASVDVLCAMGVLPDTLSSAFRAGIEWVEIGVHTAAEFGEGFHVFYRTDETMPILREALTYWSAMAGSTDVQQAVGIKLDGLLDREPFARRGQVETIVEAVMGALERAS